MTFSVVATMTSKGQLTVPKPVREALGLHEGARVRFEVDPDQGTAAMEPLRFKVIDLWAFAVPGARRMSLKDMEEAIRREAAR